MNKKKAGTSVEASISVRAAWLHFIAGLTQAEVADRLAVSRAKAHRLISAAIRAGAVKVSIEGDIATCVRLEEAMKQGYPLGFCNVVPDLGEDGLPLKSLGQGGAHFLQQAIARHSSGIIGIGHGRTLMATVDALPALDTGEVQFMSLLGGLTRRFTANPHDVIHRLAERTGAEAYVLPVPFLANSPDDQRVLLAQHGVREIFDLMGRMDLAFVGIGSVGMDAQLVSSRLLSANELSSLGEMGACGEVLGHFFTANGTPLESEITERITAPSLADLRRHEIVAVAGGPDKVDAIRSVLSSGVLSGLITDETTARTLVER